MAIKTVKDASALKRKVKDFFDKAEVNRTPKTIPALAEHLGWMTEDIITYPKEGHALSAIINYAKLICENWLMEQAMQGKMSKEMFSMIMKMHFGYGESGKSAKPSRSISSVLDDIEEES